MDRATPPAILLGGDFTALSVARSLAAAGVRVHALGGPTEPVRHSRFCAEFVDGAENLQERALEYLESAPSGAVVLPCSDDGLELVARHRTSLLELGLVPIEADSELLLALLDKERTHGLAAKAGIAVPETVSIRDEDELRAVAGEIGYPCALKPASSHDFTRHFPVKGFVAENQAELEEAFRRTRELGIKMMVTEMIPGPDDAYPSCFSYLDEQNEPLFILTKRKFRQYPIRFGSSCYHVTDWDPEAAELGVRFLRSVGMRGLAHVEFKRDTRDGRLKLIECNPRLTGTAGLFRAAGADLPLFIYNRLVGRPDPPMADYRKGMGMWWPLNDFRAFRAYRSRGELSFGHWAGSLLRRQHFPLASRRDPMPTIAASGRRIGNAWRKLRRRARDPAW
jgi:D-aspartate ligase